MGINLWWVDQQQSQAWYAVQAEQLGRSLSQQKALQLASWVRNYDEQESQQRIQYALDQLLTDPHTVSATLYDFRGRFLAGAGRHNSVINAARKQFEKHHSLTAERLTFVADVVDDKQVIGYLQVQLATPQLMAHHTQYQQQLNQQRLVFMLLAALGALYITRGFYKLRFKFQRQWRAKARLLSKR
ncbi:AhpA/YtjB family protein [Alteromonas oceanisediminis]|uniref:AhpA/YtjB family protein n=1 Tax=Alteromonas oceanisediminis TaxID=2836180 RepID=UPI001BD9A06A|nr:AhpA/YtjB family protein [Alteromonas oceanisediminis]MBT0585805.1 hypothetical protein [Alteromonas oceanisediminis]